MTIIKEKQAYEVDLVNELVHEPDLSRDQMGLTDVNDRIAEHTQWYKWAKAAAPEVGLIVNEYDLYQSGNDFHSRFVDYVTKMIEQGAPIDGIGMQGHFFGTVPDYPELKKRLAEVAVLGLPMAVTEFDMVTNTYEEMERVLYSVFSEPLANNFTVWGAWDGRQWRNNAALYNLDWSLKPSGRAWFDLVKDRWRTDTSFTAQTGSATIDAFHGQYDIYVERDGQVFQQTLELDEAGATATLVLDNGYSRPTGELNLKEGPVVVYPTQPVTLAVTADAEIEQVTFYDGVHIIGVVDESPFELKISREDAGDSVEPAAEVSYRSGYRERLTAPAFEISSANQPPSIRELFPASGTTLLLRQDLALTAEATDPNGDPLSAYLLTASLDTLRPSGNNPFRFELGTISAGTNRFTLYVNDDKFGTATEEVVLNIVEQDGPTSATSYPVVENDDIEEREDGSIDASGDLDLGEKLNAIRFAPAGIPEGVKVDSAFVQFTSEKPDQTGQMDLRLYAEKAVTPAPLSPSRNNLTNRSPTTATVTWEDIPDWKILDEVGPKQKTPDLTPIIQELVDQDGWDATAPVHLFLTLSESGNKRSAYSADQSEASRPMLTVYYTADYAAETPLAPVSLDFQAVGGNAGAISWEDPNPAEDVLGYHLELNGEAWPAVVTEGEYTFVDLAEAEYTLRVQVVGKFGVLSPFSEPLRFTIGNGMPVCGEDGTPDPITDGLTIEDLGKFYTPNATIVPAYLQHSVADRGGTTSVRRSDSTTLRWKTEGYYQRNRELGQVFNIPPGESLTLDAVVLRTGNSSSAILDGAPGAEVYMQFYEVTGTPVINDNGTPIGTESEHGFNTNHRTDDYLEGVSYEPIAIVRGGIFPDLPPTTANGGQPGHLRYLRWDLRGDAELLLEGGKRYAFTVGFTSNGPRKGFSLGNDNQAASGAAPALRRDANGNTWWSIRREGDGTLPPTQVPGEEPPADKDLRDALMAESLYAENHECTLSPTTDGFPDVDTYRTLEFYLETVNDCPPAGTACDDGNPDTDDDLADGNCNCYGVLPDGCRADGMLTYQRYDNLSGRSISDLRESTKFPDAPDVVDTVFSFAVPSDVGDNYGARLFGYICPTVTGLYTFFVAGDDNVEFNLGTDSRPESARRIAFHDDYTAPVEWNKFSTQESARQYLEAGVPYYVEALVKEQGGGDHLAVGWELPDGRFEGPIGPWAISTVTGDGLTSVREIRLSGDLGVFPNPAIGEAVITILHPSTAERATVSLFSLTGERIQSGPVQLAAGVNRLPLSRPAMVPAGIYLIKVSTGSAVYTGKIVWN